MNDQKEEGMKKIEEFVGVRWYWPFRSDPPEMADCVFLCACKVTALRCGCPCADELNEVIPCFLCRFDTEYGLLVKFLGRVPSEVKEKMRMDFKTFLENGGLERLNDHPYLTKEDIEFLLEK